MIPEETLEFQEKELDELKRKLMCNLTEEKLNYWKEKVKEKEEEIERSKRLERIKKIEYELSIASSDDFDYGRTEELEYELEELKR